MENEEARRALETELDRVTALLSDAAEPGKEHLRGYGEGVRFALSVLSREHAVAPEPVPPAPARPVKMTETFTPEPELLDQVERVRDTES